MTQFTISLPPVLNRDAYEEIHEEQVIPEQSNESESASLADEPDSASSSDDVLVVSDTRSTRASGTRLRRNPRRSSTTMHSLNDSDSCPKRRPGRPPKAISVNSRDNSDSELSSRHTRRHRCFQRSDDESSSSSPPKRASKRRKVQNRTRARAQPTRRHSARLAEVEMQLTQEESGASFSDSGMTILTSDVLPKKKRNTKTSRNARAVFNHDASQKQGTRQSERSTRMQQNMREVDISQIYRSDSEGPRQPPKATGVREAFQVLPTGDPFRDRHCKQCDTCGNYGGGAQGQLIHCQGCTLSYHRRCIGHRTGREHLVTKIASNNFVFQCRRCISFPRRKESTGPEQGMCQTCREIGPACVPFRSCKTPAQEEKERDDNDGEDPIASVDPSLINNPDNVLFRCTSCWRGFHFHHLLPRSDMMDIGLDDDMLADERFREYAQDWICRDCSMMPAKVSALVAWRPVDPDAYREKISGQEVPEDDKEYLIKWEDKSYFRAQWMQGAWTWGVTAPAMRKAFAKRESCDLPIMRTEDAIPEDFLRIDIVLDVHFTSIVDTRGEEIDKARIKEVKEAFIKYKGLGYEDAVWETVPSSDDGERWIDFVRAYDDWVAGRYIRIPKSFSLKNRLDKARSTDFNALEKKKQPETLTGGELMKYQLDGLNWLCYRWYSQKNAVLADEMGLGKTIQIIGLFATLVSDYNCFPFLIVVPNSTCPNWRHEIKQWAPSLRVVTYFGSSAARSMAYRYELFPEGSKSLRCHIVVTSYEAAADTNCQKFFRSVPWQGLIVDEGQRLKNDRNQLYGTLSTLKIPFSVLLTGTPLQNNARELFNLLQFLDASFDAEALELEYAELTKENLPQLHALIRPFFLRRTKAEVLTFLPPMGQVIVPVAMTVLQKKLYMSILAKNPQLIKAIFNSQNLGKNERASLSNILMQLRKCLSHPFVYNKDIEERSSNPKIAHRNLVEASPKLHLLQLMLPKLKQRGHRVLIFSQFLDNLDIVEDFLDGLGYRYQRLDGSMGSLQKQKRIDEYNAPESPLFAFLLSTRAGGIGINLATADTVIILDPDFNPHQDIQALSRAHRIGQKKKVLCFQLMTIGSAEEKIVQIGRKKMALDHVLIEQMDADEDSGVDVESILRHGAAEILEDKTQDIRYDEDSVDKLLDRTQMEDTRAGEDHSAESQFSFARVWANDKGTMEDAMKEAEAEQRAPDPGVWDKILQERERAAAQEAARRQENLGRGKRARQVCKCYCPSSLHIR